MRQGAETIKMIIRTTPVNRQGVSADMRRVRGRGRSAGPSLRSTIRISVLAVLLLAAVVLLTGVVGLGADVYLGQSCWADQRTTQYPSRLFRLEMWTSTTSTGPPLGFTVRRHPPNRLQPASPVQPS
jgi:hypothetical protein